MLSFMRDKAGSWLIKIVLFAIVIVFVFWGVGSFRDERASRVAEVNGEPIGREEYRRAYNNQIENLRRQFRDNLTPEMLKMLQVKTQVVNGLINQKLILQAARKLDLRVTDQELVEAIRAIPAFQTAGSFDRTRYQAIMNQIRMAPEAFEAGQRQDLLINKLRAMITGGIHVSEGEAREFYNFNNTTVSIDFALFSPDSYKDIDPTPEEVAAFFEERKEAYKTEPLAKVRYLQFTPDDYKTKVTVEDSQIADYYETYPSEFSSEKTVEARHILKKVDENAPDELVEEKRLETVKIVEMARGGKDFAELAKKHSEGPSKDKGGHLGTFKRETMVKPFADKAFSMKAGDISDPVRTRFGWHIIKVEKVNEESVRSLEDAAEEIRKKLIAKDAREMAFEQAELAYDAAFTDEDLEKTAEALKVELHTTPFFNSKGKNLGLADAAKFAAAAFDQEDGEVSNVLELDGGYVILEKIETQPEKIPELSAVQADVRLDLIKDKQSEKAKADAEAYLGAIKAGADMAAEGEKYGVNPVSTGFFKREEWIPQLGYEREIAKIAFELSDENKLPETALKGSKGMYVIQFKERKAPSPEGFAAEKEKIQEKLVADKERTYFSQWLEKERSNSEIVIGDAFRQE